MKRQRKILALVAGAVATAMMLAACSDPSNPDSSSSAPSAGSATSAAPTDTAGGDQSSAAGPSSSAGTGDSGQSSSGSSAAPTSGGGSGSAEGASGTPAEDGKADASAAGTLNLFMYQKPNGLFNPLKGASGPDQEVISLVYEGLMTPDPSGKLVPLLADGMPTVSADAKTFTFKIKKGLKWSDGQPVTSKDVLFTYTRSADPNMDKGQYAWYTTVEGIDDYASGKAKTISGFSAPDDYTFVMKLTTPNVGIVGLIGAVGILPEHVVGKLPIKTFTDDPYFAKPTVGTGPFTVAEFKTDQYVHLTANPNFRYQVGVKDVFIKILTSDVATQQLQTGEIDATTIAPVDLDVVKGFAGVKVDAIDTPGFVRAAWNQSQERFKDPKVLQAFLYGTDRKSIVDGALKGQATVRNSVFGPPWQSPDLNQYPYDPAKAKQLLQEAGWDSSKPVELSWISAGNPDRDAAAQVMQNQLKNVGIDIKLNQVQSSWFSTEVPAGKFDMIIYGGGDYTSEPANVIPITTCQEPGKGPNNGLYCNKDFTAAAMKANQTTDLAERTSLYQAASKLENADPSQMWLFSPKNLWAVSDKFQNYQPTPLGASWFEAWNWKKAS